MSPEKDGPRNRPGGGDPATMKTPSASYSFTIRLQIANRPGMLGRVASAIGAAGGDLGAVGLGDIGPEAALPVMEGKAMLFKEFGGVDAFPICLATKDVDKIVETVKLIAPVFGGINLEDIAAPRCFEVEERLRKELDIPVFHDDQHGTAVVVLAALLNALKIVKRDLGRIRVVVTGVGAAGTATIKILQSSGVRDIIGVDEHGTIYRGPH